MTNKDKATGKTISTGASGLSVVIATSGKATEQAKVWTMGRFKAGKFELVASSYDHNSLEAASARINRQGKTRCAFVVDAAHVGVADLRLGELAGEEGEGDEEDAAETEALLAEIAG